MFGTFMVGLSLSLSLLRLRIKIVCYIQIFLFLFFHNNEQSDLCSRYLRPRIETSVQFANVISMRVGWTPGSGKTVDDLSP